MRRPRLAVLLLFVISFCVVLEAGSADADAMPMPQIVYADDDGSFSPAEFERLLHQLKSERDGLTSDWRALRKRNSAPEPTVESEQKRFESLMQKALEDLRRRRQNSAAPGPLGAEVPKKKSDPDPEGSKKPDSATPAPDMKIDRQPGAVDVLAQAHALMRSQQYEEALAIFQQLDLKSKKVNERTPIQYLRACCLLHLGKTKEAAELLQEVANYRGDEKVAGYAQWHLEMMRWQRDVDQRLQEIRQRRKALEPSK